MGKTLTTAAGATSNSVKTANRWREYHDYLKNTDTIVFAKSIEEICDELGFSVATYYRVLGTGGASCSKADKNAIASIYKMPVHFLFPEMLTN